MAKWSAPAKVVLFGEHAVVYDKMAIALAIKNRVYCRVKKSPHSGTPKSPYIRLCFEKMGIRGASVHIQTHIPRSSGLGSSSALTVATLFALNDEFELEKTREEIAEMAFEIEKTVQKGRASRTDTAVSTHGGMLVISKEGFERYNPPKNLHLVIGNSQIIHNTAHQVERVASLIKWDQKYVMSVFDAIDALTQRARKLLISSERPDLVELGNYMSKNNALLESLDMCHPTITNMIIAAKAAGAYGAKMTGAGGGGSMIALSPKKERLAIARAIRESIGMTEPLETEIFSDVDIYGARKERDDH